MAYKGFWILEKWDGSAWQDEQIEVFVEYDSFKQAVQIWASIMDDNYHIRRATLNEQYEFMKDIEFMEGVDQMHKSRSNLRKLLTNITIVDD